ncbi:CHRD domain-containing protein [Streptomyces sp. H27-D2]|uniref:CHRD domain-containing protein n=1 Tax=Streptomyces sp. H27-D2 TaxID=3046304 RepID=UPI002DB688FF|nr:CHRD domain-containing protein [Streptomyces sp. H27-D2]MEC4016335.1 CHRD domain-containing protein [Streptomyces sp. H27-D2]
MRVLTSMMVAAVGCATALTGLAASATAADTDHVGSSAPSRASGRAHLDGRQEVPGPGDRDGRGEFWFQIRHGSLCYSLQVRKIARPTAAHIHAGRRGVAGPIVITLKTPHRGESKGCITAQHRQTVHNAATVLTVRELREITRDPHKFYVNVHNKRFPDGAIRGQLAHR